MIKSHRFSRCAAVRGLVALMKTGPAFARGMRLARERVGMTQAQLAEATDLHVVFISQLEREKRTPAVETIDAVADALGLTPWELLRAGAESRDPQRKRDAVGARVRAVVEAWPEADHDRLFGFLTELGRLATATRARSARRARTHR